VTVPPDSVVPPDDQFRANLANSWAHTIYRTAYSPVPGPELEVLFAQLVDRLVTVLWSLPFVVADAERVGGELVRVNFTGPNSLRASIEVLSAPLFRAAAESGLVDAAERVVSLFGSLSAGYISAMRTWLFDQQEQVKRALLRAMSNAQHELTRSEARFREVFAKAAVGIAISDGTGDLVEVNPRLAEILGYEQSELVGRPLREFFHRDDRAGLSASYEEMAERGGEYFRRRLRLQRADGQTAWVYVLVSALREADDAPDRHLTMIEDVSDLHLLQGAMSFQSLHDVLTGLPNRQYLMSRLQGILGEGAVAQTALLYHLDLDGFSVIDNGLGMAEGDRMLSEVATRLLRLFSQYAERDSLVVRLGGDEFAVLVRETGQPDVLGTIERINEELAEPVHRSAGGIALSASIGVASMPIEELNPEELVRAADVALRRAKSAGKRQWALYDKDLDQVERGRLRLAAALPGALEFGQLAVEWLPWQPLQSGRTVALSARMRWNHEEFGVVGHEECIALAERTGAILTVGEWLVRTACTQANAWRQRYDGPIFAGIELAEAQVVDPDLVRVVRAALDESGLPPTGLWLAVPARVLVDDEGEARENLTVLAAMGVGLALRCVGCASGDLAYAEDWPIREVELAESFVARVRSTGKDSLTARSAAALITLAATANISVSIPDIRTEAEADWWRSVGARSGSGPLFGGCVDADRAIQMLG
jgi:diguanylate cyclase (GGDEF)-like protein/PAS domain S-box-containing protein